MERLQANGRAPQERKGLDTCTMSTTPHVQASIFFDCSHISKHQTNKNIIHGIIHVRVCACVSCVMCVHGKPNKTKCICCNGACNDDVTMVDCCNIKYSACQNGAPYCMKYK